MRHKKNRYAKFKNIFLELKDRELGDRKTKTRKE